MYYVIEIAPLPGESGVVRFLKSIKKRFFFFVKVELTTNIKEALVFYNEEKAESVIDTIKKKFEDFSISVNVRNDYIMEEKGHLFYAIERDVKGRKSYYTGDDISKETGRVRRSIPIYDKTIEKADFFKSESMANVTLNRLRQTTDDNVVIKSVYLTVLNDYTIPCIILGLKNIQTKRTRFIKSYDINGTSSDRIKFVDTTEKAMKMTIPQASEIYEDIHQKHKMFEVKTGIYRNINCSVGKFRFEKISTLSDYKFKTKNG